MVVAVVDLVVGSVAGFADAGNCAVVRADHPHSRCRRQLLPDACRLQQNEFVACGDLNQTFAKTPSGRNNLREREIVKLFETLHGRLRAP